MQTSLMGTSVSLPVVLLHCAVLGEYHHHSHIRNMFEINENYICRNTFKLILIQINEEYILLINPFILDNQVILASTTTSN